MTLMGYIISQFWKDLNSKVYSSMIVRKGFARTKISSDD